METTTTKSLDTAFKKDVYDGLNAYPKYLHSKYIYDKRGDRLFQDIMEMDEYYLTNCEFEILESHKAAITESFRNGPSGFDLIELGAGDGKKTRVLLDHMVQNNVNFTYRPIDISENAVNNLTANIYKDLPGLAIQPEVGEYFQVLKRLQKYNKRKKVIMVLGSNIGNLPHPRAIEFLTKLASVLNKKDLIFMGFDQKKDPKVILDAYNDPAGITAAFNKNLLHRINRELGANFELDKFSHWETYNPETGTAKSFLVAQEDMEVSIDELPLSIKFSKWETIHTEISQKYDANIIQWMCNESGLQIKEEYTDSRKYYKDYIFCKGSFFSF